MSEERMAQGLPDLTRIRRNWDRVDPGMQDAGSDRLQHVRPPLDPFVLAAPLLARLQREIDSEFPEQRSVLAPFIARVDQLFERMRKGAAQDRDGGSAPSPSAQPAAELRAEFVTALNDLEDLCEALLHVKR